MFRISGARLLIWLLGASAAVVCLGQNLNAPAIAPRQAGPSIEPPSSDVARVVSLTGDVSVLRDSYPWALNIGDDVQRQQLIVTGADGFAVFELSDGSSFQVFPNSRVTFRNNPGDWRDILDVWLGRIKVFIQKLGDQPNRNRVFTPTAVISVRGTVFDVVIEDEDETTLVSVEEGLVNVRHRLIGEGKSRLVGPGEYIRVYRNEPLAKQLVDKGALVERILRASAEALYTVLVNNRTQVGGSGTPSGGGPTLPGDTGNDTTPTPPAPGDPAPAPAPPPPPPPPPGG